jgi:hypothetical protein
MAGFNKGGKIYEKVPNVVGNVAYGGGIGCRLRQLLQHRGSDIQGRRFALTLVSLNRTR